MSILSLTIISVLLIVLCVSIYFNVRFGIMILKVQDAIEDSLDMLDERYASISKILEIPLFYDSTEIRSVLNDVEATREIILEVARLLASIDESAVEQKQIENKGEIIDD